MLQVSSTNPAKLPAVPSLFFDVFILNPTCAQSAVKLSLDVLRLAISPGTKTAKKSLWQWIIVGLIFAFLSCCSRIQWKTSAKWLKRYGAVRCLNGRKGSS